MSTYPASLESPFRPAAVIEDTLLRAFPAVWRGVYYFDPRRNHDAEREGGVIYSLISNEHKGLNRRRIQDFGNYVTNVVRAGSGMTIPLGSIACYLMIERKKDVPRLSRFFGEAALVRQDTRKLGRLFEEYVARHETYHSVEMLQPHFHTGQRSLQESERGADAYALLSMLRDHGSVIHPFARLLSAARDHQYARDSNRTDYEGTPKNYLTQPAISAAAEFAREKGTKAMRAMPETEVFRTAQHIARQVGLRCA